MQITEESKRTEKAGNAEVPPPSRQEWIALAVLAGILFTVLASLAWRTGVTVDEPAHIVSAFRYWSGNDDLGPGDMPPLIKIVGGWVPRWLGLPLAEPSHPSWRQHHEWPVAQEMMTRFRNGELQLLFFASRLPMLLFPIASVLLAWWWSRQIFSRSTGMICAVIVALSPTFLGHGHLFKNDVAAAFAYVFFAYRAWRYWRRPDAVQAGLLGAAVLLGLMAKFSLVILLGAGPVVIAARLLRGDFRPKHALGHAVLAGAVVYAGVLVFFPGPIVKLPPAFAAEWRDRFSLPLIDWVWLAERIPAPRAFLAGVHSVTRYLESGPAVYLLGNLYEKGHPLYFLVALGVKVPVSLLVLILSGFAAMLYRFRGKDGSWSVTLGIALAGLIYLALASLTPFQAGVRLVLPALLCFLIVAAGGIHWLRGYRTGRVVVTLALFWLAGRTCWSYPRYISYFNSLSGGPSRALHYLSDSNVDWGQGLPNLASWLRERPEMAPIRLCYFGFDSPHARLPRDRFIPVAPPWGPEHARGTQLRPEPGYWAVSVSLLSGHLFAPEYRDYFAAFREREPVARAGNSIYIYRF